MKRESLILSALVGIFSLTTGQALAATITGTLKVDGMVSGGAMAGTAPDGKATTPEDVKAADDYIKRYSGPSQFMADYTIVLDAMNRLDPLKSTVKFDTLKYTSNGTLKDSNFRTTPITITGVKFMNDDPTMMIESFMFSSTNWYPMNAVGAGGLTNNGLSGTINLKTGQSSYNASYIAKDTGAIYKYEVTGTKAPDKPFPDPPVGELGSPEIFSPLPVPEPTSALGLLALGALGAGLALKRKLNQKLTEKETTEVG